MSYLFIWTPLTSRSSKLLKPIIMAGTEKDVQIWAEKSASWK